LFVGKPDLTGITGPVGIVGAVGDASAFGLSYLLSFAALISLNLAIINLIPFPALDGGRLFFLLIESITRRPIPAKVAGIVNTIGFGLLLLLMLVVTFRDVKNLL
jgi:regulator of sigma E protease